MSKLQKIRQLIQAFNAGVPAEELRNEQEELRLEEEPEKDIPMMDTVDQPTLPLLEEKPNLCGDYSNILNQILYYHRHHNTTNSSFIPTLDTITSLSYIKPLQVWCSLLNESFMSTFLDQFKVQSHLSLLYRYFLFGYGAFVQGVSTVFFSKQESKIGLEHIGHNWPPKPFHLNMVLRDVLLETAEHKEDDLVTFQIRKTNDTSVWKDPNGKFSNSFNCNIVLIDIYSC